MSAIEKCHDTALTGIENGRPSIGVSTQLSLVAPPKLSPTLRPMPKPLPQLRTGRDFLDPCMHLQSLLLHTSRPQALHEDATPISTGTRFISTLDAHHESTLMGRPSPR